MRTGLFLCSRPTRETDPRLPITCIMSTSGVIIKLTHLNGLWRTIMENGMPETLQEAIVYFADVRVATEFLAVSAGPKVSRPARMRPSGSLFLVNPFDLEM